MKINAFANLIVTLVLVPGLTTLYAQSKMDSVAIQTILQDEDAAWTKGDATAYARAFAKEGTFTNIAGMFFTGHKAFLEKHEEIFKGMFMKTVLHQQTVSFRFVRPDVALVETLCRVTGFSKEGLPSRLQLDAKGQLITRLLQVMAREPGGWKIVSYHNVDVKPGTPIPD